jgi:hypothetical protein
MGSIRQGNSWPRQLYAAGGHFSSWVRLHAFLLIERNRSAYALGAAWNSANNDNGATATEIVVAICETATGRFAATR